MSQTSPGILLPATPEPEVATRSESPLDAALAIVELRERLVELTPEEAAAAIGAVAAPESAELLSAATLVEIQALRASAPAGLVLRVAPLAANAMEETKTDATVAIWLAQVLSGAGGVRVGYSTVTVHLRLVDGRWMLSEVSTSSGPVPSATQEATDPDRFEAELVGFESLGSGE